MSWLLDAVYFIAAFNLAFAAGCYWCDRETRACDPSALSLAAE